MWAPNALMSMGSTRLLASHPPPWIRKNWILFTHTAHRLPSFMKVSSLLEYVPQFQVFWIDDHQAPTSLSPTTMPPWSGLKLYQPEKSGINCPISPLGQAVACNSNRSRLLYSKKPVVFVNDKIQLNSCIYNTTSIELSFAVFILGIQTFRKGVAGDSPVNEFIRFLFWQECRVNRENMGSQKRFGVI